MKKNINGCKGLRKAEKENVEEALFKWFTLQRSRNLPITGAILQAKANEFAELFEEKSFVCSNGWLDSPSDMEEEEDKTGSSIADAKAAANVLNNFFATGNIDEHVVDLFKIEDKKIDELYICP
ncbi:hypothetical protein AVEN_172685-1 [Araneus ventricosus]|uniref:HTH CENPB-type domain-containing protein n=1 Tax=Araneus ventricosus TaxID=182803 RepID=A0A4Y2QWY0_ARAVE|nr:hypothetical protein AVEN_172685-1 [Araneus ventricosus]